MFHTSYRYHVMFVLLFIFPKISHGEVIPFWDFSLGLGVQTLESSEEGVVSYASRAGLGLQFLPFMSVQANLLAWRSIHKDTNDSSNADGSNELTFEGLGISWEATLQIPFIHPQSDFRTGPYYRFGQQCWSIVATGALQISSGRGCNDLHAIGVVLPSMHRTRAAFYIEVSQTNFDDVASDSIQVGVKVPL